MCLLQVLLGYFVIPSIVQQPINATLNPIGDAARSEIKVWNAGDNRVRLVVFSGDSN